MVLWEVPNTEPELERALASGPIFLEEYPKPSPDLQWALGETPAFWRKQGSEPLAMAARES